MTILGIIATIEKLGVTYNTLYSKSITIKLRRYVMYADVTKEFGKFQSFSDMDEDFSTSKNIATLYAKDHHRIQNSTPDYKSVDDYDDSINKGLLQRSAVFQR